MRQEAEKRLGAMFRQINLAFCKAYNRKLERHNLTSPQSDILMFLAHREGHQATQRQIEMYLHLKNPTVTGLLNRLEEKQYVKRTQNPRDRRSHVVILTEESKKILADMWQEAQAMEQKITEGLSEDEKEQLFRYLEIVLHNFS